MFILIEDNTGPHDTVPTPQVLTLVAERVASGHTQNIEMASKNNFKAPPAMTDGLSYKDWVKELEIWSRFTEMNKNKQGGALFLTLEGKPRRTVLDEVTADQIDSADGVKHITKVLDALFLKDKSQMGFQAYDEFIKFRRTGNTPISDFLVDFNLKYNTIKSYDMTLPDGVLAYTLLTCANLSDEQARVCTATVHNLTYDDMRKQIERVCVSLPTESVQRKDTSVIEPQFYHEETSYDNEYDYEYDNDSQDICETEEGYNTPNDTYYTAPSTYNRGKYSYPKGNFTNQKPYPSKLNPPDEFGKPTPCRYCHSVYHWIDKCPDAPKGSRFTRPGRGYARPGRGYARGRGNRGGFGKPL